MEFASSQNDEADFNFIYSDMLGQDDFELLKMITLDGYTIPILLHHLKNELVLLTKVAIKCSGAHIAFRSQRFYIQRVVTLRNQDFLCFYH